MMRVWRLCLSIAYIGPKSRTEGPKKTKIGPRHMWLEHHFQKCQHARAGDIVAASRSASLTIIRDFNIRKHKWSLFSMSRFLKIKRINWWWSDYVARHRIPSVIAMSLERKLESRSETAYGLASFLLLLLVELTIDREKFH